MPLQLPVMVQIMPERSGNVHVRAAVKYWVVNVPVKNPDVVATGVMAIGSVPAGLTVKIPVLNEEILLLPNIIFPDLSIVRKLAVSPALVILKISAIPPKAWRTIRPEAVAVVGKIVCVEPESVTKQSVHIPPLPPVTVDQVGAPAETTSTSSGLPISKFPKALGEVANGIPPMVYTVKAVPPRAAGKTPDVSPLEKLTGDEESNPIVSLCTIPNNPANALNKICPELVNPVAPEIRPALIILPEELSREEKILFAPVIAPAVNEDNPISTVSVGVVNPTTAPVFVHPEIP